MPFSCESVALHERSSTFQDDWHVISSCGNFASKLEAGTSLGNWIVYLEPLSCWNSRVVPPRRAPGCWGSQHKGPACSTSNMPTKLYPRPIFFFFSTDFFFFSISWERNHHFWLLVVLVHVLRIVDKLKCLCSGLQHSQSSFSYERDASSEWTLATLGITPLCRNVPATRKWTTRHFSTPEQPPYPPHPRQCAQLVSSSNLIHICCLHKSRRLKEGSDHRPLPSAVLWFLHAQQVLRWHMESPGALRF